LIRSYSIRTAPMVVLHGRLTYLSATPLIRLRVGRNKTR
jgi:hypothetical protein